MLASADIYQNEYDASSFSTESKVIDEIWENQRWQPGFGYCALFAGTNNYSDFYGINTGVPPSLNPPPGWRWISDWEVDLKGNYGSVDEEGWLYGSSFDRLLNLMKNKRATGIRSQSSLVRRRRWIRNRICKTQEAQQAHMSRIELLQNSRSRLETTLRDKKDDVKKVLFFEKARHQAYYEIATTSYQTLLESPIILQRCIRKLQRLKTFLLEKAALDREHFKQLESFTSKYNPEETLTTEKKITRTSNLPPLPLDPSSFISDVSGGLNISSVTTAAVGMIEATVNSAAKAFYSINCLGEGVVSKRIYHLATTIVDQILLDLDTLLADFNNTLKDAKQKVLRYKDKFRITDELTVKSAEAVATAFENCRMLAEQELWNIRYELQLYGIDTIDCFWSSRNPLMNQKLFHNDITEPPKASSSSFPSHLSLTTMTMTSSNSIDIITSDNSILDQPIIDSEKNIHEEDTSSPSTPTPTSTAVRDDVWLRVQIYRKAVVTIRDELHRLASQATRGKLRVDHLMNRAKLFYLGTIQLFVHEQVLAWTEAADFLKKMGTDIGIAGGPNTLTYNPQSASYITVNAHQNLPPSTSTSSTPLGNSNTENDTNSEPLERKEQRVEENDGDDSDDEVLELPLPPLPTSSAVVLQSTLRVRKLDSSHLLSTTTSTTSINQTSSKSHNNDSTDSNTISDSNGHNNNNAITNSNNEGNNTSGNQRSSMSLEIHPIRSLQAFLSKSSSTSSFRTDSTTTPTAQSNQHDDYSSNNNSSDLLGISMSKATEGFSELFRLSSSSSSSSSSRSASQQLTTTETTTSTSTMETQDDQIKNSTEDNIHSETHKDIKNTIAIDTTDTSSTTTSTTISVPSPASDYSKNRQSSQQDSTPTSSRPNSNNYNNNSNDPSQAFSGGIPDFFRKASSNIPDFFRKSNPVYAATSRIRFSIDSSNYQPENVTTTTPTPLTSNSGTSSMNGVVDMKKSNNESNNLQQEIDFDVHSWTTVRAIVTTDGMLHLFQPRIDSDMTMNSLLSPLVRSLSHHHSHQSMITIEDDSLLLLKSIYIKKCTVLPVEATSMTTIAIKYPSDVTTLGASLLGILNNKLSGNGNEEGILLLTRDETEAVQWRTLLTDPLPLSKQITTLPTDSTFHPSLYTTTLSSSSTGNTSTNPLFRTTSSGEQSPSRFSFDRRDSIDSSPDSPLDNKIPDFRNDDIACPGSPKFNDNDNNNNNNHNNPPLENEKKASSTRNTPMRPKSFNNRLNHRNRNLLPHTTTTRMIPLPQSSSTSDSSWIRTPKDTIDSEDSNNNNTTTQQEVLEHSLSFHPIPIRIPKKEKGPKQIIPFTSSSDINMPLALKRSDYIQTYEKGLEEEKQRSTLKMLENKNKALNEYTLSVEGELLPEDEEGVIVQQQQQFGGNVTSDLHVQSSLPTANTSSDTSSTITTATSLLPPNEPNTTAASTTDPSVPPTQQPPPRIRKSRIRELRQSWQKADSMSFIPFLEEATTLSRQDAAAAAAAATTTPKSHVILPMKTNSTVSTTSSSLFHSTSSDDMISQALVEENNTL